MDEMEGGEEVDNSICGARWGGVEQGARWGGGGGERHSEDVEGEEEVENDSEGEADEEDVVDVDIGDEDHRDQAEQENNAEKAKMVEEHAIQDDDHFHSVEDNGYEVEIFRGGGGQKMSCCSGAAEVVRE